METQRGSYYWGMSDDKALIPLHPEGEPQIEENQLAETPLSLDTFAGKVQFRWVPDAEVSSLGQMPIFIEYLKTSGVFENWVNDCPLQYSSPNAPQKRDVLGTILLSVLAGHWRYAHISALRGDGVNPELLGMSKVASEDSVRRALTAMKQEETGPWLQKHLRASYEPLLEEAWALDMDATVKPLYGHQEDAKVGYNPQKPGRPSHVYHSYFGHLVCTTGVVVATGRMAQGQSPEVFTRGLQLGNGAGDGRSRAAWSS